MARLVIVSNRVASPKERAAKAGGLAVALREALSQRGGWARTEEGTTTASAIWDGGELSTTKGRPGHLRGDVHVSTKPADFRWFAIPGGHPERAVAQGDVRNASGEFLTRATSARDSPRRGRA